MLGYDPSIPPPTKRIIRFDASAIKDSACFRKFWLTVVEGYKEKQTNHDTHYGTCFHKCAETIERTGGDVNAGVQAAVTCWRDAEPYLYIKPKKKYLNVGHLTMACNLYGQQRQVNSIFTTLEYHKNPDTGEPLVEQKFSIPVYEDEHYLFLLQGTIDGIGFIKGGCNVIPDWKTTASYEQEEYFEGYKLSPQMLTYFYGLWWYLKHYPDSSISRVLRGKALAVFIFGAFLSAGKIVEFGKSPLLWFGEDDVLLFEKKLAELVDLVMDYATMLKDPASPFSLPPPDGMLNGACVSPTGFKCKFFAACAARTSQGGGGDKMTRHILDSTFKKKEYKPFEFGGGHVAPAKDGETKQ